MAMNTAVKSERMDIVFDTYRDVSIKDNERAVRGQQHGIKLKNITSQQKVRQWREFLKSGANKTSLITYFVKEWRTEEYRRKLSGKMLYVTDRDKCFLITESSAEEVPELYCTQEEADGRILLHASHAAKKNKCPIVIVSEDTDVLVLSLACNNQLKVPLYQLFRKSRKKLYDIHKIAASLSQNICKALVGLHAFTGCDSVSTFARKGKVKPLKITTADTRSLCKTRS